MDDLLRRYWAGGYHFGDPSQLEHFLQKDIWKVGWSVKEEGKPSFNQISEIKVGDFFALKSIGGRHDLKIAALGIAIENDNANPG